MITLEVADLVVIAGRVLGLDAARALNLLDPAAAERALTQVRPDSDPGEAADRLASWLRPAGCPPARVEEPLRARPALPLAERIRKATARRQPTGRFQRFTDGARRTVYLATAHSVHPAGQEGAGAVAARGV